MLVKPSPSTSRSPEAHAAHVLMHAKRLTLTQLARRVSSDAPMVSRVLNGRLHRPALLKQIWLVLTSSSEEPRA